MGCNWKAYITRDQLWAKPRPTFELGGGVPSGLPDVCSMFARSCKRGIIDKCGMFCVGLACDKQTRETFQPSRLTGI